MSAPVTHDELGIGIGLLIGGGLLMFGLFILASAFSDITPSQRGDEIGCGSWMVVIGAVFLILTGVGALL